MINEVNYKCEEIFVRHFEKMTLTKTIEGK